MLNGVKSVAAQKPKTSRNANVEVVRFIAAIGIVWFHSPVPYGDIGLAGLSLFFVYLIYFASARSLKMKNLSEVAQVNLHLIKIWLVWCAIYLALKIAQALVQNHPIADEFELWMWITGPALHLWFLPYSYVVIIIAYLFLRFLNGINRLIGNFLVLGVLALAVVTSIGLQDHHIIPVSQYLNVLPPIVFAISLARYPAGSKEYWFVALAGTAILIVLPLDFETPWVLGCVVACITLSWRIDSSPITLLLGRTSLTIYLIHPAVSSIVMNAGLSGVSILGLTILTIIACITISILIDRMKYKNLLGLR